jgi:hypothetical protein
MTVCIAAICNIPRQPCIIGVADRMMTVRDAEYEPRQSKFTPMGSHGAALIAGDLQLHAAAAPATQRELSRAGPREILIKEIADIYADEFAKQRRYIAERMFLTPLNLNIDTFITGSHVIDPSLASDLTIRMQNAQIDACAIVCGLDRTGPHIYKIIDPGEVVCFDATGFAIIGLTNPLIFDSNVNHEHLQEADVDSSFVAARAEPRKTETWPPTRGDDDTSPN